MPDSPDPPPPVYAVPGLDRAAHRRLDSDWLRQARNDPRSRVVLLSDLLVPTCGPDGLPSLHAPSVAQLGAAAPADAIFLGERDGIAWFAADQGAGASEGARWVELRAVALLLAAEDAALLAYARALVHWHRTHRFCGHCGGATVASQGGHARHCAGCGRDGFPRTDPAVIVLVTHGERCLLGRSPRFPPGMYSTLAGFVEPGESLEQTLRREVREEVGIEIEAPVYRGSQPWPFPQSLMLGFRATARGTALTLDRREIEDARWLDRAELIDPARRPVRLPNPDSIARRLIEEWLAEAGGAVSRARRPGAGRRSPAA